MMSRKHYEAIAKVLKENNASSQLILDLAEVFENDNSNFNTKLFLQASI